MNFDNKVVIVTGAARGLGQEYARQFSRLGARVAVNDLRDCSETLSNRKAAPASRQKLT
jgi:NAD(P)-dependent dehydrogenase (short-subunit alcohol dehydrogenase family)